MGIKDWVQRRRPKSADDGSSAGEGPITIFDERGRELQISRQDWKESVLQPSIEKAWGDADVLYQHVVQGLDDGFFQVVLGAAERLVEIDDGSERAHIVLAIVRLKVGDLSGAEQEIESCIARHGRTGVALTNLAKVYSDRGEEERSEETLREALGIDPNQDNALMWWTALRRETGGDGAYERALEEIAQVEGAWRPQLWLARECLGRDDVSNAVELYGHVLAQAKDDPGVLMTISGDLGNAGALEELVRIVRPHYDPKLHGPEAGMNLAEALKQLGRYPEAMDVVRSVSALGLAPFAARLAELECEIAGQVEPVAATETPEIVAVPVAGALWTRGLYEPDWLLPDRGEDAPSITFVALADETAQGDASQVRPVDASGRTTRAVPLFLAEACMMRYAVRTTCLLLVAKGSGPAVFRKATDTASIARLAPRDGNRRVVIAGSVDATRACLTAWDANAERTLCEVEVRRKGADDGQLAAALCDELARTPSLTEILCKADAPDYYRAPSDTTLGDYASALEQLCYQVLVANEVVPTDVIWNERGFFETYFSLAERSSKQAANARLIAICGVAAGMQYASAAVTPYRKIVLEWLDAAPRGSVLDLVAPAILKRLGEGQRLEAWLQRAPKAGDPRYDAWLERVRGS
jgi:tetratricopeptide (TPR) repeat protein